MVAEGVIEKFIGLDMSDAETVFDRCLAAINKARGARLPLLLRCFFPFV